VLGVAVYLRWVRAVITAPAGATGTSRGGRSLAAPRRRPAVVVGLVLASTVLVVVSVQPDLLLRLLG
jgi:NADH-quinone oxidoreductase subunit N